MALCWSSVWLTDDPILIPGPALDYLLPSSAKLRIPLELSFDFRGPLRSEWRFARTFQDYLSLSGLSSDFAIFFAIAAHLSSPSAQRKDQITRRRQNGAEHSAPEPLNQLQWLGFGIRSALASRLASTSGHDRDQTLGLRSVVPLASSSWFPTSPKSASPRATQSCRGAKQ